MKNTLLLISCILFFTVSKSFGREQLANENKSGLYAKSIEQVLRLDEKDVDLATAVLIISEQWNDNVYGRRYVSKLDDMAFEIRNRLEAKGLKANYKAIAVINEYLFDELGFKSVSEANNPDDLFLHTVMDKRQGYCLSLSVLYLSLGERLGLPLYGVVVPGHFFVRYDDGRVRFNIEATGKGGYADDEHYIDKFKVPAGNNDGIYMQNLNKIQTLGCFFNNLGNSYSDIGNIEQAMLALERAVEINPSLSESRANLGNIYLQKGRIEDAIREYRTAMEINPGDAKTHNNLGNAYARQERLSDAILQYHQSLELDPNFVDAYKNLANAYCRREMFSQAQSALEQAIVLEPKNAGLYSQAGDIYSQQGDYEAAILQYKEALKIRNDFAEAYYGLGVCYNRLGQGDDEIRAYKNALSIKPDMTAALANLGNAYFARQKYDAAIEQYKKVVQLKGDDAAIYYNLGAAYSNSGLYEEAVAEYLKAVEIKPGMGDAHRGLGFGFYNLKKYDLAWKHIKTAEELGVDVADDLRSAVEEKLR